jgi:hypothetical protein
MTYSESLPAVMVVGDADFVMVKVGDDAGGAELGDDTGGGVLGDEPVGT